MSIVSVAGCGDGTEWLGDFCGDICAEDLAAHVFTDSQNLGSWRGCMRAILMTGHKAGGFNTGCECV